MSKFTVVSVYLKNHSKVLEEWLLPCLDAPLVEKVILQEGYPGFCLAAYNNYILDTAETEYVVFAHPDVRFSKDVFEKVVSLLSVSGGGVGAVGLHGSTFSDGAVNGTTVSGSQAVCEIDCCFFAVRRDCGFRFDSWTFNELHGHVEDLSWQLRAVGLKVVVVEDSKFEHLRGFKGEWGRYVEFRTKLRNKWAGTRPLESGIVCVDDGSGIDEFNKIVVDFPLVRKIVVRKGMFGIDNYDWEVLDCSVAHVIPYTAVALLPRINDSNFEDLRLFVECRVPVVSWVGNNSLIGLIDHLKDGFVYHELQWAQRGVNDIMEARLK